MHFQDTYECTCDVGASVVANMDVDDKTASHDEAVSQDDKTSSTLEQVGGAGEILTCMLLVHRYTCLDLARPLSMAVAMRL
jgi:hypothetical protein